MAYDLNITRPELVRLHNPWEKFTQRQARRHNAEDVRLCSPTQHSSLDVIDQFMTHSTYQLELPIPHRRQLLRDYLLEAATKTVGVSGSSVETDIGLFSHQRDIALLDDRQNHPKCARPYGNPCSSCMIFSKNLSIPQLFRRLIEDRQTHKAEKRIIFIPNLTSAGALALAATVSRRTANPLRDFLHRHLIREHHFSISASWGFILEFHIPYHAMRSVPPRSNPKKDERHIYNRPLRDSEELPLREWSTDDENLHFHQAQTSSLSLGPDEWFWTEYFLVDTYFGSEDKLSTYLSNCQPGDGADPPLGGGANMKNPCFDPREYLLLKIERRIVQVTAEYKALIETFNRRMEEYLAQIRRIFEIDDNAAKAHTRTISDVIETIQILTDCIGATVDAWDTFKQQQLSYFTVFAPEKPNWGATIERIVSNMAELKRLRQLLLMKRGRLQFKLDSIHTVSSLSQTGTAIAQGENIKTLTQMTVYVAFPLLFTTALFSMDMMAPSYPWAVFFGILLVTTVINHAVAPYVSPFREWLNGKLRILWEKWRQ